MHDMKHLIYLIPTLFLTLHIITACHKETEADITASLDLAAEVMQQHADSALSLLSDIDPHAISTAPNRARYALLYSQALDKTGTDLDNDSVIAPAIAYYSKNRDMPEYGVALYYLARIYENAGDIDNAIKTSVMAEVFLMNAGNDEMLGLLFANRGYLYSFQYNMKDEITMYKRSIHHYLQSGNTRNACFSYLALSNAYDCMGDTLHAIISLDRAQELAQTIADTALLYETEIYRASLYANIDSCLPKARDILLTAMGRYCNGAADTAQFFLLSNIYHRLGNNDSALYYIEHYTHRAEESDETLLGYYALKSEILGDMQRYREALACNEKYTEITNRVHYAQQQSSIKEMEIKYKNRLLAQSYKMLHMRHIVVTVILTVAVILFLMMMLLYRRYKEARINEYYHLLEDAKYNYSSLKKQFDTLKQFADSQQDNKFLFINTLDIRIETLRRLLEMTDAYENNDEEFYRKCREYLRLCNDNKESVLGDLQKIVTLYCGNVPDYLRQHYPRLNNDDINICCMECLHFTPQQIRILFNYSNNKSIYTKRNRLRNKLRLPHNISLGEFLQSIVYELQNQTQTPIGEACG